MYIRVSRRTQHRFIESWENYRTFLQDSGYSDVMHEQEEKKKRKIIANKKKNFLGGPWRFYYVDKDDLNSLHNQITPIMKITEKEIEKSGETSKGFSAEIPIVKPSYEKKGSEKEKKKMEPRKETSEMKYSLILKHLTNKDQGIFGVEEFLYDRTSEKIFEDRIGQVEEDFNYHSHHKKFTEGYIQHNRKSQVNRKIEEIRDSQGKFALIQGNFTISKSNGDGFLLNLIHPISEALGTQLILSVHCTKSCMTRFGTETFGRLGKINARIFGTVTLFDEKAGTVDVDPITIH